MSKRKLPISDTQATRAVLRQKQIEELNKGAQQVSETGKDYARSKLPKSVKVRVNLGGGNIFDDAVKGLNVGHALRRAAQNWPHAVSIERLLNIPDFVLPKETLEKAEAETNKVLGGKAGKYLERKGSRKST